MKFDVPAMLAVLPTAIEGWMGVFVVIAMLITVITICNFIILCVSVRKNRKK